METKVVDPNKIQFEEDEELEWSVANIHEMKLTRTLFFFYPLSGWKQ